MTTALAVAVFVCFAYLVFTTVVYVSLTLIERRTKRVLFESQRTKISGQSWSVPTRGLVTGTVTFLSIDANNELTS